MTEITKEFFDKTLTNFELTKQLDDNFIMLMFDYYKNYFHESKHFVKEFGEFKNFLYLWINTPVTTGNSPMEMMSNIRNQTFNKGINNTINYFKQKFNN